MPSHVQRHPIAMVGLVIGLVLSGCSSAARPSVNVPLPSRLPTAPAAPPPSTTLQPTAASVPSEFVVAALPESGNTVFPGRYTTNFEPSLTLTIDRPVRVDCVPGYRCRGDVDVNSTNWLDLEFGHDHPIEIHVMSFHKVFDPKHPGALIDPPSDLAAWVSAMPGLSVVAQSAVQVGGADATRMDIRFGSSDVALGPSGLTDLPTLGFGAHRPYRLIVFRKDGAAIVIGLGSVNAADDGSSQLAIANDILESVVDSITWQ